MIVLTSMDDYSGQPSVVALGMFDGVHIGHQRLIRTAVRIARARCAQCVVCTFDRHPLCVIAPEKAPVPVLSLRENLQKMEQLGANYALVQAFNAEFAALEPEAFVRQIVSKLNVRAIVVGENYTFGRKGMGNAQLIRALAGTFDYEPVIVPPVMDGDRMASSTYIRELRERGEWAHVQKLLAISEEA
ncbi:MAG: FAD synthetase family protein [Clostridia bacterium]|nr:FAD synthetase family protein [Clostridia bacterium]